MGEFRRCERNRQPQRHLRLIHRLNVAADVAAILGQPCKQGAIASFLQQPRLRQLLSIQTVDAPAGERDADEGIVLLMPHLHALSAAVGMVAPA